MRVYTRGIHPSTQLSVVSPRERSDYASVISDGEIMRGPLVCPGRGDANCFGSIVILIDTSESSRFTNHNSDD